jgi:group II intron reverse transcriptase/maturase
MPGAQEPENLSTKLQRIAALARARPQEAFTSLAHHLDLEWLQEAYRRTRKDGAVGIDGETAQQFSTALATRLSSLLDCAHSGQYRAPPVRRVYIPKANGALRPLGIPTFSDKVLQRAVAMLLEAVFEQDFHWDSYGFRPGRSAHQMLAALQTRLRAMGGGWVIELDIRSYFDTIDHGLLRRCVQRRVRDGVLSRLLGKWLRAGVLESGRWSAPESGTPQGGVISPLLANIYLHEVLDHWFATEVQPRLSGRSFLLRYADDAVLVFANAADARRVLAVLAQRFARFGLELHPEKTRLVDFRPPPRTSTGSSFDLLGLTHYWGRSRRGTWTIHRKTAKDRFRRTLQRISHWCRTHRHDPVIDQQAALSRQLMGHYAYFGVRGNYRALSHLRFRVEQIWLNWLGRRSQRRRRMDLHALVGRHPLPAARLIRQHAPP